MSGEGKVMDMNGRALGMICSAMMSDMKRNVMMRVMDMNQDMPWDWHFVVLYEKDYLMAHILEVQLGKGKARATKALVSRFIIGPKRKSLKGQIIVILYI